LRSQRLEFLALFEEQFELDFRIGGVILGPTGREGLAVFGHREGVDGEEHEKVMVAQRGNSGTSGQLQADGHRLTAEAGEERTRPSADRLRHVFQDSGFSGIATSRLQTDRVGGIRPVDADTRGEFLHR
jgi:hypothetical protein